MLEKIQLKTKSKQPYTPQYTAYSGNMDLESCQLRQTNRPDHVQYGFVGGLLVKNRQ